MPVVLVFWGVLGFLLAPGSTMGSPCRPLFERLTLQNKAYWSEVRRDPSRILLRPRRVSDPQHRWSGLFTQYTPPALSFKQAPIWWSLTLPSRAVKHPIRRWARRRFGAHFDFTPFQAISHSLVDKPTRALTKKGYGHERELSLPVKLSLGIASGLVTHAIYDWVYKTQLTQHIVDQIEEEQEQWDELIESDYRFNQIKEELKSGQINSKQARQAAWMAQVDFDSYYNLMAQYDSLPADETSTLLLGHPVFAHLRPLLAGVEIPNGLQTTAQYQEQLGSAQVDDLVNIHHSRLLQFDAVRALVHGGTYLEELRGNDVAAALLKNIENDSFFQALKAWQQDDHITNNELLFLVQEDIHWQHRFHEYDTLGLIRLKAVDGRLTDEPLTLHDLRLETIQELASRRAP